MKIKSIKLVRFRRFTNLTIELPESARLVVMIGPNGSGKSTVFDALLRKKFKEGGLLSTVPDSYLIKFDLSENIYEEPEVEFYTESQKTEKDVWRKSVHVRSPYRNDAMDTSYSFLSKTNSLIDELRFKRLSENDRAVASNYDRILSPWVERVSARIQKGETVEDIEDDLYGELQDAIEDLFKDPQLTLIGLGSPKNKKIFEFNKGTSQGFSYENLSSGEKAALDLILDIIVAKKEFKDTVFCIDEPEAHIHTKLQGPLLGQLYNLIPDNSQLWIATHSIGMVRKAQDLWRGNPDSVVFLDFGKDDTGQNRNFDKQVTIRPAKPDPNLWAQTYEVALGDLSELVASEQYIFCEGEDFDEICYSSIFATHHPETRFISIGGKGNVEKAVEAMKGKISKGAKVIGVVDRDRRTGSGIKRKAKEGIRTLEWGRIEDYLLHDEVLTQLCVSQGKSEKIQEFLTTKNKKVEEVINDDTIHDKRRPTIQRIQEQVEMFLELTHSRDTVEDFMTDILVPLIKPDMEVYKQLHKDIFGD